MGKPPQPAHVDLAQPASQRQRRARLCCSLSDAAFSRKDLQGEVVGSVAITGGFLSGDPPSRHHGFQYCWNVWDIEG